MSGLDVTVLALKITCIPVVALGCHALLRRRSAATRHLVLVAGLVALLLVPPLSAGLPVWTWAVLPDALAAPGDPAPAAVPDAALQLGWRGNALVDAEVAAAPATGPGTATLEIVAPLEADTSSSPSSAPAPTPFSLLLTIWISGTTLLLAAMVAGMARLRWIARRGRPSEDLEVRNQLADCCRRAGIDESPEVILSERVDVPVIWGWRRPCLLLPANFASWMPERRRMVLLHELGHLRRSDWPVLVLGRIVKALYWFHPLVWSLESRARQECERACDDLAVRCGMKPSDYAWHLLSIARGMADGESNEAALAVLRRRGLKTRLTWILDAGARREAPSRKVVALAGVALLALLVPFASLQLSSVAHAAGTEAKTDEPELMLAVDAPVERHLTEHARQEPGTGSMLVRDDDQECGNRSCDEKERGARDFARAYELHHDERWDEAIEAFERSIESGYRPATAMYNIACGHARKGDVSSAIDWLGRAMEAGFDSLDHVNRDGDLDPIRSDRRFQEFVDRAYEDAGRARRTGDRPYEEALELAERMRREGSTDAKVWAKLGVRLLQMRELPEAIAALGNAIEHSEGKHLTAMYNLACAHSLAGNSRDALQWLERAVSAGFDSHERFVNDSDLNALRGDREFERIAAMSETLSLEQFDRRSWERSNYSERRWAPAIEIYTDFVAKYPKVGRGWFNLGYALHYSERFDEAIAAMERAGSLGYREATAAYNVACANARLGRHAPALDALERAVELGFSNAGHLEDDEDMDSLRDEPRFRQIVDELRAKQNELRDHKYRVKERIKKKLKETERRLEREEGSTDRRRVKA